MSESTQTLPLPAGAFGLLLVDDHPLFRESFGMAVRQLAPHIDVVTVASIIEATRQLELHPQRFDLVLLDYRMPGTTGLAAAIQLRQRFPDVGFGLISGEDVGVLSGQARDAGLSAFLSKSMEMSELMSALERLSQGESCFHESVMPPPQNPGCPDFGLTERQMEVIRLLATGASNKVIAQTLGISPSTVKNHLDSIFDKMGVGNRLQAVVLARALLS
jgi:two-component system, NarL family, nitrate/nitrite response regulator NarL